MSSPGSCFNPRTHTGCDLSVICFCFRPLPAWFQSTHPHGVRPPPPRFGKYGKVGFQSTHPHGVRRPNGAKPPLRKRFQSTHPHGVRRGGQTTNHAGIVSIHAPTRGATPTIVRGMKQSEMFQSTHPHGVRHQSSHKPRTWHRFNPRTHTGCDGGGYKWAFL